MIIFAQFIKFITDILSIEFMGTSLLDALIQISIILIIFKLIGEIANDDEKKKKKGK